MTKRVAIIGAGVSGLAVAWYLRDCKDFDITIYEKNAVIGGNCQTRWITIGGEYRFCDLGVNDFNTRTYSHVVMVMDEIGIQYRQLEDSACFYSRDGAIAYTIGGLNYCPMPASVAEEFKRFKGDAPAFLNKHPKTTITIGDYLKTASPPYSEEFGRLVIFPRVNAMYFVDPHKPAAEMPFRAVMRYYILQEGFGTPYGPLRMYFHEGAQNWLERLAQYLKARVVAGAQIQITRDDGKYVISNKSSKDVFDIVVFACHANEIRGLFRDSECVDPVYNHALKYFRYAPSTAYGHTYTGILPPDTNLWSTYNVTIHDPRSVLQPHPYSMTYVCNKHQNDGKSGRYNFYGGPQFLVTLNPPEDIKEILENDIKSGTFRYVLRDANPDTNTHKRKPIRWSFPHNIVDNKALDVQEDVLPKYQGQLALYFTGGWCYGSGLHEECWIYSAAVAEAIKTGKPFVYPHDPEKVPPHISRALA